MLKIPENVEEVARKLHADGYHYAEAYPIHRWKKEGWPENPMFFKLVDGCLKILWAFDEGRK